MKDQRFWSAILFGFVAQGAVNLALRFGAILVYGTGVGKVLMTIYVYAAPLIAGFVGGYVAAGRMPERRFVVAIVPFVMAWFFSLLPVIQEGPTLRSMIGSLVMLALGLIGATVAALVRRSGLTSAST